jgi:hypothetical protein
VILLLIITDEVTVCMKLNTDIHIVMHSVLSLNPGVTNKYSLNKLVSPNNYDIIQSPKL